MAATNLDETPGPGIFKNENFMTPDVYGFARKIVRGRVAWVELSSGDWMRGMIWGVTFRRADGGQLSHEGEGREGDPSDVFDTKAEALEYLDGFGNA